MKTRKRIQLNIRLIHVLGIIVSLGIHSALNAETLVKASTDAEMPVQSFLDGGRLPWASPVVTFNDAIYVGYVDPNKLVRIIKQPVDGPAQQAVVFDLGDVSHDKGTPSMGIDRDGYIHVTAGMHNGGWLYYVSKEPENVEAGFREITYHDSGKIGGDRISYPTFVTDRNGELYVHYRARPGYWGISFGATGGAIARYHSAKRQWVNLGAMPDHEKAYLPVLAWELTGRPGGGGDGWYQAYRMQMIFDAENRMHVSWVVFGEGAAATTGRNASGASHLMYVYSEDGGLTFRFADGSPVEHMPVMHDKDPKAIVVHANPGDLITDTGLSATKSGSPVIAYNRSSDGYLAVWEKGSWQYKSLPDSNIVLTGDSQGTLFRASEDERIYSSTDNGDSWSILWKAPDYNTGRLAFDHAYTWKTGNVRFRVTQRDQDHSIARVITLIPPD